MPTYNNAWTTIDDKGEVDRFPVVGGWLVRVHTEIDAGYDYNKNQQNIVHFINIKFVPDLNHTWK